MSLNPLNSIKGDWSLFLDRDGVINKRPLNDYVRQVEDFHFLPGTLEALRYFNEVFARIIVITNQQGVGKGLMTIEKLHDIHSWMQEFVKQNGGRIDAIYSCTDLASAPNNCRKPDLAMAKQAQQAYPEIRPEHAIMVGDTASDILFGKNAGMKTVLIGDAAISITPDMRFESLLDFAFYIKKIISS
ncbi:MAG: HAD-IIIA family hydrolase [Bacteroidetes bacterium]|nr:HAD-IIIA family hydrolase [Bacteroidota bacterium]MBU1579786.1 HAD-IIIA family hydrolase [Bacteroidota bacterium]MBU2556618.1 HAD-IIIA family hydrolase [Bacteroidota bacterium]